MKKKQLLFILSACTLTLTSCANYRASPLYNPSADLIQMAPRDEAISVVSKTFTRSDCNKFLDRDVLAEGYQPIQLYIQNDSDKNYIFSLDRITLPLARPEMVAEKVHTSTAGRAAAYGAGALILWPLIIPAVVDGVKSANANEALDKDFTAKAAKDQVILHHSQFNAIIFVPVDAYQNSYNLTLVEQGSAQSKVFHIVSNE